MNCYFLLFVHQQLPREPTECRGCRCVVRVAVVSGLSWPGSAVAWSLPVLELQEGEVNCSHKVPAIFHDSLQCECQTVGLPTFDLGLGSLTLHPLEAGEFVELLLL